MRIAALILMLCPIVARAADAGKLTFDDDVAPVLRQHCQGCHGNDKQRGGLNLATYGAMKLGGSSGEVVTGGDPDKSRLFLMTAHKEEPVMPPSGTKIPDAQLETIRKWIELGAAENKGSKVSVPTKPKVDLALKTVARGKPDVPPMPANLPLEPITHTTRPGSVLALAASPWAPVLAVGGQQQVVLIHADTGAILGVLPFTHGQINSLKFSRNGKFLLAAGGRGGMSGKAVLYEVETGKTVTEVGSAETDAILTADLSADQSNIAVGTTSRLVRIYQVSDGALLHTIKKHTDWVTAVEYSPDGVLLATADRNGGLFVWEAVTAREFHTLRGPTASVNDLSWRADGNLLATASLDNTVRLWEMENGREVKKWNAHNSGTESVRFLPDGRLVTTGRDKLTKLWDASGKQLRQFPAVSDIGLQVVASHDNSKVVAGDWAGTVQIWSSADGKPVATVDANPAPVAEQLKEAQAELAKAEAVHKQALATHQAAEAAVKAKGDALAATQANANRLAAEQGANAKALTEATEQVKKLAAEEQSLNATADKLAAGVSAIQAMHEARQASAAAYALAAKELQSAASKSPKNAPLQALAAVGKKTAAAHAAEAQTAAKSRADVEAATKANAEKLRASSKALADARAAQSAMQKKANELVPAVKAANDALPGAKAGAEAAQKALPPTKANLDAASARLTALQAKVATLRKAVAKK